jgi:glutamine amidotransferase
MITIVDYGLGNIKAFANIYERLKIKVNIAKKKSEIVGAEKIILPGVGAFDFAMSQLNRSGMRDSLEKEVISNGVPVLGICVGMQMLANSSQEGELNGLGWIDGFVNQFDRKLLISNSCRLPHMGWNNVKQINENKLFRNVPDLGRFYFLHSYYFTSINSDNIISTTDYGIDFASSVNRNNIYGVQFHPEKSHSLGVQVLNNFANITLC